MNKLCAILILSLFSTMLYAQTPDKPFIRLVQPYKEINKVNIPKNFIIGATCTTCTITANEIPVKVFSTGAFAVALNLKPGDSNIIIVSKLANKFIMKKVMYSYHLPVTADTVKTLAIENIASFPEGNLLLQPGDKIQFKVKALPNCTATILKDTRLYEMPLSQTKGMPGIYQGEYEVKQTDSFSGLKIPITITDSLHHSITRETKSNFSVLLPVAPDVAITKGRLAHLEYGLGDDRLGGAKIGYIDSNIVLKIIGKVGTHYKVQLAKARAAYIPDELVTLLPKGTLTTESLTGKIFVDGDERYDYVKIGLFAKLPYQVFQLTDPAKIVVDIFGATNNTNWITQLQSAKEIKQVDYEQLEDGVFRVTISLQHAQAWGHQLYYNGNNLVIKIKQQPKNLSLKNLTIAVDAGHGGTNTGAVGATGIYEKEITLALALKLQTALQKNGAKVIMTRTEEKFVDNKERILFYRDSLPDLLLSLHLNSADDPLKISGTSTYYRSVGFKNLSTTIYKRMLELGLNEYGNTGSFNFMLNSPTEYPNALIETLFLSNLEEEAKIIEEKFQLQLVDKIVQGVKDFLDGAK